jgi:hypothetical protein
MRIYKIVLDEERECYCGYETSIAFEIADTEQEAFEKLKERIKTDDRVFCANCLVDYLIENNCEIECEY